MPPWPCGNTEIQTQRTSIGHGTCRRTTNELAETEGPSARRQPPGRQGAVAGAWQRERVVVFWPGHRVFRGRRHRREPLLSPELQAGSSGVRREEGRGRAHLRPLTAPSGRCRWCQTAGPTANPASGLAAATQPARSSATVGASSLCTDDRWRCRCVTEGIRAVCPLSRTT
eukprot:COSAG06_NODE_4443_length_4257_cov_3.234728_3_plen_171_part_00